MHKYAMPKRVVVTATFMRARMNELKNEWNKEKIIRKDKEL
jgi:hypothetical protein